jgi:phosphatidylglycerol:prolipoprotein diacylglycerol transferase
VHPLLFHLGPVAIPTYGVLTAAALLAALAVLVLRARHFGISGNKAWNLGLLAILAALFASRLLLIAVHFQTFRQHPFWVLGLASIPGEWVAAGGAGIGLAIAVLYALAEGLPVLRLADAAAPALALAFAINRVGAFFAGLSWGKPTTLPWAVTYRSVVSYLWYRTPLAVALQPVQLYDAAASLAILALLLWIPFRRAGEAAGLWLFLYGLCRFFLEFLHGGAVREPIFGELLTLTQAVSILAVLTGGILWLRRDSGSKPPAVPQTL